MKLTALLLASTTAATNLVSLPACNPAHSYPGVTCISTAGGYSLVPTAGSKTCNLLDVGASCYATATTTATQKPLSTAAASSPPSYSCNPAHSYPNASCISTSGSLTLVYPSSSSSSAVASSPVRTRTSSTTKTKTTKGTVTHTTYVSSLPPLKTDTTAPPPVPSASVAAASTSSTTPASGGAAEVTFGGVMALVVFAGLLAL